MENEPRYQFNVMSVAEIKIIDTDVFRAPVIELAVWLDNPDRKAKGRIPLTKEIARDIANQLLTLIATTDHAGGDRKMHHYKPYVDQHGETCGVCGYTNSRFHLPDEVRA